jgi:hypothetical protein
VVIGVTIAASTDDANVGNIIEQPRENQIARTVEDTLISQPNQVTLPVDEGPSTDDSGCGPPVEISENTPVEETVKRSSVKVLRGILKKSRRYSKDAKTPEQEDTGNKPREPVRADSMADSVVPEVSSLHSDDAQPQAEVNIDDPLAKPENPDLSPYKIQRGSLQMAAFDRVLFAKRGAELRNEYLRGFQ